MKVIFLGTGTSQGVPVIACDCDVCRSVDFRDKRTRSSVYIDTGDHCLVIDTGPDFRQQMLRERIKKLDAILFTHAHKDHTAGMDDVRSFNFRQQMDMPLYASKEVVDQLKREFAYVFAEKTYPGVPKVDVQVIENKTFSIGNTPVIPVAVMHYKLPVFGFRIKDFTYITDANYISEVEKEKVKGSRYLVLNALQKEDHISHFNLDQALALMEELQPEQGFLTHISHKMGRHKSVKLPDNVEIAYDGLTLDW